MDDIETTGIGMTAPRARRGAPGVAVATDTNDFFAEFLTTHGPDVEYLVHATTRALEGARHGRKRL